MHREDIIEAPDGYERKMRSIAAKILAAEGRGDCHALVETLSSFVQAVEFLSDIYGIDRSDECIEYLYRALRCAEKSGDTTSSGEISLLLGDLLKWKNEGKPNKESDKYLLKAKECAEKTGNRHLLGRVYTSLAFQSRGEKRVEYSLMAIDLLKDTGDEESIQKAIATGMCLFGSGCGKSYVRILEKLMDERLIDAPTLGEPVFMLLLYGTDALKKSDDDLSRRIARLLAKYDEYEDLSKYKKYEINYFKEENEEDREYVERLLEIERKIKEEEGIGLEIKGKMVDLYDIHKKRVYQGN